MLQAADQAIRKMALEMGSVQPADMAAAMDILYERRESGLEASLGQILIERGLLTTAELGDIAASGDTMALSRPVTTHFESLPRMTFEEDPFGGFKDPVELARGGMGTIFRATDPDLGREVAIKVLNADEFADRQQLGRFLREAQITGQLEHPNIVPIYGLNQTADGQITIAMKLVRGRSLGEILSDRAERGRATAPIGELLNAFVKVCDAIAFAHSRGVVHRDLKPANIMIGEFGEVLVMDWGIAKVLGEDEPETAPRPAAGPGVLPGLAASVTGDDSLRTVAGSVLGTPAYMPPEQAEGLLDKIDERSDVYSLGAVLYEILALSPPFRASTVSEMVMTWAAGSRLEPPSARLPEARVPRELDAVVLKAMAPRRGARYRSASALQADVVAFLQGQTLTAVRYGPVQLVAKWVRRNKAVSALIASVLLGVLSLAGVFWWSLAERRDALAEQEAALAADKAAALDAEGARTERARRHADFEILIGEVEPIVLGGHRQDLTGSVGRRLQGIVRDYPEFARGHFLAGRFHHRRFEFEPATAAYRAAIETAGDERLAARSRYHLAHLLLEIDPAGSISAEARQLCDAIDPGISPGPRFALDSLIAYLEAGMAGDREGDRLYDESVRLCEEGLSRDPSFADLHYRMAVLHGREMALALDRIEVRDRVFRLSMTNGPGPERRDYPEAERSLRRCLTLDPGHERAQRDLAICLMMEGRTEEGLVQLEALCQSLPDSPVVHLDLVHASLFRSRIDIAEPTLVRATGRFQEGRWMFDALLCAVDLRRANWSRILETSRRALASLQSVDLGDSAIYRPLISILLHATRFYAFVQLDRDAEADEAWAAFLAYLREFGRGGGFAGDIGRLLSIGPPFRQILNQVPSFIEPPMLRRPAPIPGNAHRMVDTFSKQVFGRDQRKLREGIFDPLEKHPFQIVSLFLALHDVFATVDTHKLRSRVFLSADEFQPGIVADFFYLVIAPYAGRLYADRRVELGDPVHVERLMGALYLVDGVDMAYAVNDRFRDGLSQDPFAHLSAAYLLAAAEKPIREVAAALRTARALGVDVAPFVGWKVFDRYRDKARFQEAVR